MPSDLQVAYYIANDDTSDLENYDLPDFVGINPKSEINKLPVNARTPEVYAAIYRNFLFKVLKTDLNYYDFDEDLYTAKVDAPLYYIAENVPAEKFSEKLNQYIRMYIMKTLKNRDFFGHSVFDEMPDSLFSKNTIFTKNLIKIYPDYIFDLPENSANVDMWIYAFRVAIRQGGFTGPAGDGGFEEMMEYQVPENIKNDPRIQSLAVEYDQAESARKAEQSRQWEEGQRQREEQKKQQQAEYMASLSGDSDALGRINKAHHTPEMYQTAISHHPKAIFHVPAAARTKELWLQSVTADPSMIEYVRPFELQAEINQELNAGNELEQIKNLSQPK
jgi:hypothetical protein